MESASGAASIVRKMLAVMNEVGYVQKDGKNEFHGYRYASEANAIAALRPALIKHGLVMVPSVEHVTHDEHGNTHVEMLYRLMDAGGNCIEFKFSGSGNDRSRSGAVGDKGIYKAITGANKYALLKTFLLETGDDPEEVSDADRESNKPKEVKHEEKKEVKPEEPKEDLNMFADKMGEHAKVCTTVAELTNLWKANLPKIDQLEKADAGKHAELKKLFRDLKTKLKEKNEPASKAE